MPKVEKTRDQPISTSFSQKALLVYIYENKRVVSTRRVSYQLTLDACRVLFPTIPKSHQISCHTKELDVCDGQLTEVVAESWEDVVPQLKSIVIMSEDVQEASRPHESLLTPPRQDPESYTLHFHYEEQSTVVKVRDTTRASSVTNAVALTFGSDVNRFKFCGGRFGSRLGGDYMGDWGVEDGDHINCFLEQLGGKPVIYVLSPEPIEASVKLSLKPEWELSAIYPVIPNSKANSNSRHEVVWQVRTHQNGDLTELQTGLDVSYLFWEAHTLPKLLDSPPPSPTNQVEETIHESFIPNDAVITDENAVILSVNAITPYLDASLKLLGLHTEARTSFITYWLPSFLKHKQIALRFLPQAAYEKAASLDISPPPDVVTRIFMLFKGIAEEDLSKWPTAPHRTLDDASFWVDIVGVDTRRTIDNDLFRVIEWGGMEVLV